MSEKRSSCGTVYNACAPLQLIMRLNNRQLWEQHGKNYIISDESGEAALKVTPELLETSEQTLQNGREPYRGELAIRAQRPPSRPSKPNSGKQDLDRRMR
jgi:hypothetical protein